MIFSQGIAAVVRKHTAKTGPGLRMLPLCPYTQNDPTPVPPDYVTGKFAQILNKYGLRRPDAKHTGKIFSLRLMDFQEQAYILRSDF